ncbi:AIPR family protein [Bacillus sp. FSL W8-0519]|uniref:AIPR family protein n=1 Tax=Bacillus TaxID=1386 RepID=UPI001E483397|nr:AIPR family protein [Bacillus paranthracis]MBL3758503.1 AIPR family protein [Bacillus cereus]MCC2412271.1 AIPR family protein [Bacillus paranthracis]
MNLIQQMEKIILFQVNEAGLDESTVDIENKVKNLITEYECKFKKTRLTNDFFILSNGDLSLNYEDDEIKGGDKKNSSILFIFCYANEGFSEGNIEKVLKKIKEIIVEDKTPNPIVKLFFISKNLKTAICSQKSLEDQDIRGKVLQFMKDKMGKYYKRDITATFDYLESVERIQNSQIGVLSRTRATQSKSLNNPAAEGYVFSANLFDLVELYNKKGKTLFLKNIRYGIADELDVDSAINETLMKRPEEFWYLNNGITLILEKNNLNLQNYEMIGLSDAEEKSNGIQLTVINGAQTLNSAAKFFYKEESQKHAREHAFVMLKVIEITSNKTEAVDDVIDKITISLNRQKPIIADDIAFTLPVVKHINNLREKVNINKSKNERKAQENEQTKVDINTVEYEQTRIEFDAKNEIASAKEEEVITEEKNEQEQSKKQEEDLSDYVFSIVRRGDVSSIKNKRYTLKVLPRILYALLLDQPGTARNASNKVLIDINDKGDHFKKEELFPTIQNDYQNDDQNDDEKFKDVFVKNYKPVNFAMALFEVIDMYSTNKEVENKIKEKKKDQEGKTESKGWGECINKYGKYLIIYSVVKALKEGETFEKWTYKAGDVKGFSDEKYIEIITILANSWDKSVTDSGKWDSNAFKIDGNIIKTYTDCKDRIKDILNFVAD